MKYQSVTIFLSGIEQKGITFDHDFGYSFPLFSSLLKKRGKNKRRINSKNRDQKSCLSAPSLSRSNLGKSIQQKFDFYNNICTLFRKYV